MMVARVQFAWGLVAASAMALAGCDSAPPPLSKNENTGGALGARSAASGLELRAWVVDNTPRAVQLPLSPNAIKRYQAQEKPTVTIQGPTWGELLKPYEGRKVPLPQATIDLWRSNGMRVYSVPIRELGALKSALQIVGPSQDRMLGQTPVWTEIVRGPQLQGLDAITTDAGSLAVQGGSMRLLARAWLAPGGEARVEASPDESVTPGEVMGPELPAELDVARKSKSAQATTRGGTRVGDAKGSERESGKRGGETRAMLQVEVLPQHYVPRPVSDVFTAEPVKPALPEEEGLVFERLALRTMLKGPEGAGDEGDALVIVPEVWSGDEDAGESVGGVGPRPSRRLTIGEALLTDKPRRGAASAVVFVVLVPRVAGTYSLLAP